MDKKQLTPEEIYKKNQKRSKIIGRSAPFVFWGFWAIAIISFIFALQNSIGNVAEICDLLDGKKYNDLELENHYLYLVQRYGEWRIGSGSAGFKITFVNIGRALFNGVAMANLITAVCFVIFAYVLGKWLMPMVSKQIIQDNQDMVNLTILRNTEEKKRK